MKRPSETERQSPPRVMMMNEAEIPAIETSEVFLDTSILYDYTKDAVPDAQALFEDHTHIVKATSEAGEAEYRKVAERRAEALDRCEEFAAVNSLEEFSFDFLEFLTSNDRGALRNFRDALLRNHSEVEALRRLNERKRTYQRGVELLFDAEEALVTVRDVEFRPSLENRFQIDIDNGNDREILCHAADWHDKGFGNTFTTSDIKDFGDGGELGSYISTDGGDLPDSLDNLDKPPLIGRINESIQTEYTPSAWLHIVGLDHLLAAAK